MTYAPLPIVIHEPCVHLTLKFNLPKRLMDNASTAIQEARVVAADEAERLVRHILKEGVFE